MRSIRATPSAARPKSCRTPDAATRSASPRRYVDSFPPDPRIRSRGFAWAAAGAALVGALAVVSSGCRTPLAAPIPAEHGDDARPRRGGTLRLASFADIRGLDPAGPTEGLANQPIHLLFAGLVDFDDRGRVVPDLALRWETVDGGRVYRFVLRAGVQMHDGTELTADDVKRSVERALHRTTPDPNASYFEGIAGYPAYAADAAEHLDGVVVEGRYVVTFHLWEPDATFLSVLAGPTLRPVCRSAGDRYVDTWQPCGAGPFKLAPGGWRRGTSLRLVRHDGYFRSGLPYLDAVEWAFNMQPLTQRFRFEAGELDFLHEMSQADQARFARDPRWRPFGGSDADTTLYGESMNTTMPPFDNVEVRRAVAAAIDREQYRLLKPAYVTPLDQPIPPDIPGYESDLPGQRYDYAAALDHMRRAGLPYDPATGRGGWPKPIDYVVYDQGLLIYTAQLLQQQLAKIGLRIELRLVSWQTFLTLQHRKGGAAMSPGNWAMDYPDPSSFFEPLFTTGSIGPESTDNTAFYSNAHFDELVARARRELDEPRRAALYREAGAILCDEAPWAFTFSYHFFSLRQPYVRGPLLHPVWYVDPTRVWIDRPGGASAAAGDEGAR
jgi:ABC-type transport system substrate-binding protein